MQRGDYPMFIFASHRKPLASDDLVRSADLSESLLESTTPEPEPEVPQNSVASVSAISRSPPPEEYVVLWPMLLWRVGKGVFKKFQKMVMMKIWGKLVYIGKSYADQSSVKSDVNIVAGLPCGEIWDARQSNLKMETKSFM